MSESVQQDWPELAKEWASAQVNMPRETSMVNRVGPMGPVEKWWTDLIGGVSGRSNFRNISLNRKAVTEDKNLKETLQHELTHIGQPSRGLRGYLRSLNTSWDKRPEEIEAGAAESKFPRMDRDIILPIDTAPTKLKKK